MPHAGPSPPSSHVFRRPTWVPSHFGSSSSGSSSSGASVRSRRHSDADTEGGPISIAGPNPQDSNVPDLEHVREKESEADEDEEEFEIPQLTAIQVRPLDRSSRATAGADIGYSLQAFLILFVVVVITGVTAEFLIGSIDGLTTDGGISREFVALILLPLVGNAAEHVTAVTVSVKDKIDLSLTIAIGSSIQIALFVIPLLVTIAWMIGQPLSLFFPLWETIMLVLTVLLVNWTCGDGVSNFAEGTSAVHRRACFQRGKLTPIIPCFRYDPHGRLPGHRSRHLVRRLRRQNSLGFAAQPVHASLPPPQHCSYARLISLTLLFTFFRNSLSLHTCDRRSS